MFWFAYLPCQDVQDLVLPYQDGLGWDHPYQDVQDLVLPFRDGLDLDLPFPGSVTKYPNSSSYLV